MFCDACGNNNEEGFVFCEKCGTKLLTSEEDLESNEAIEHLKYQGYEIIGVKVAHNSKRIKEQLESRYSKGQKPKDIQKNANENKSFEKNQAQPNNKSQKTNNFYDREAYIKEYQNQANEFDFEHPHKKRSKSKTILIIIEIIVLIAIIIIGYLLYNI